MKCGHDATLDFGRVVVELGVPFGEEQAAGQVAQHRFAMAGASSQSSSAFSVSHDATNVFIRMATVSAEFAVIQRRVATHVCQVR